MIIFSAPTENITQAKEYIKRNGFTKDDVRLINANNGIEIITKDGLNPWTKQKHQSLSESYKRSRL